jgi:hypothetical protein
LYIDPSCKRIINFKLSNHLASRPLPLTDTNTTNTTTMSHPPFVFTTAPPQLINLLTSRLPTSLSILRRLQSHTFPIGTSRNAHIVVVSDTGSLGDDDSGNDNHQDALQQPRAFTVSWFDFSTGPDTQMWLYSTLEDKSVTGVPEGVYEKQLEVLVGEITRLNGEYGKPLVYPGSLLLGSLHTDVRDVLDKQGRVEPRTSGSYDKWLFRDENLPVGEIPLPEGMRWDRANLDDCHEVVSNTTIPRRAYVQLQNLLCPP